ncbi:MAG TPA: polysaccharide biosynthesis/export family protein [Polyangiaceae bacterium]|nr:polysaccharide biosynthesis/export family protein [Polyangiaceae bacterium]
MISAVRFMSAAAFVVAIGPVSCAEPGQYVWFERLPPESWATQGDYVINVGDTVNVRVLGHDEMNLRQKVRYDGRIALPIIGDVDARGKRPGALRAELEARLKDYIVSPNVTVNIDEAQPMTIVLLGEVARPGAYTFEPNAPLAQALAVGGGLTEFASNDGIFVVRQHPTAARIRFRYRDVYRNEGRAASFPLQPGDIIEVE